MYIYYMYIYYIYMRNVNLDKWGFWLFCQVWWSVPILPWEYRRGACGKEAMQRVSQRTLQALCLHRHCIASLASEYLQTLESHWISSNLIESLERAWTRLNMARQWHWHLNHCCHVEPRYGDRCRYSHDPGGSPGDRAHVPCRNFEKGFCAFGDRCRRADETRFSGQTGDIWRYLKNSNGRCCKKHK